MKLKLIFIALVIKLTASGGEPTESPTFFDVRNSIDNILKLNNVEENIKKVHRTILTSQSLAEQRKYQKMLIDAMSNNRKAFSKHLVKEIDSFLIDGDNFEEIYYGFIKIDCLRDHPDHNESFDTHQFDRLQVVFLEKSLSYLSSPDIVERTDDWYAKKYRLNRNAEGRLNYSNERIAEEGKKHFEIMRNKSTIESTAKSIANDLFKKYKTSFELTNLVGSADVAPNVAAKLIEYIETSNEYRSEFHSLKQ